jgi:hypothetical protein
MPGRLERAPAILKSEQRSTAARQQAHPITVPSTKFRCQLIDGAPPIRHSPSGGGSADAGVQRVHAGVHEEVTPDAG